MNKITEIDVKQFIANLIDKGETEANIPLILYD